MRDRRTLEEATHDVWIAMSTAERLVNPNGYGNRWYQGDFQGGGGYCVRGAARAGDTQPLLANRMDDDGLKPDEIRLVRMLIPEIAPAWRFATRVLIALLTPFVAWEKGADAFGTGLARSLGPPHIETHALAVALWNDAPWRKLQHVVDALHRAEMKARKRVTKLTPPDPFAAYTLDTALVSVARIEPPLSPWESLTGRLQPAETRIREYV